MPPPTPSIAPPAEAFPVLVALIVAFSLYLAYELWRWRAGNAAELTAGQFRRRVVAGLLLEAALLMWLLGGTATAERDPRVKLLYLLANMLLAVIPMLLAVREAAFVMRQYARSRRELVNQDRAASAGSDANSTRIA